VKRVEGLGNELMVNPTCVISRREWDQEPNIKYFIRQLSLRSDEESDRRSGHNRWLKVAT
jgi:hypothetical protein